MGVLHSIPLCSRGNEVRVEPLDLDKNNNDVVYTSQPQAIVANGLPSHPPPEATSTPKPQSPTGLENEQYSDSSNMASEAEDDFEAVVEEPIPALSDSGLEESATEFEFSRPSPPTVTVEDTDDLEAEGEAADQSGGQETGLDEGVHENDETFDDTLVIDGHEEIDLNDDDPLERPPEPTVPDERVSSDDESHSPQEQPQTEAGLFVTEIGLKDETTRKISTLLSELVGDRPVGESIRPDLVPMR